MTQPEAQTAYYARPTDDLLIGATVTSPDEDPAYPAQNLVSEIAANPAKLLTATGRWIISALAPIAPIYVALIYQYLDSSLDVRLQGNSSNSWSSPPFEMALTIPGKRLDGPTYQPWTYNLSERINASPMPTYQWWSLYIAGTNSQACAVGRLMLLPDPRTVRFLVADQLGEGTDYEGQIVLPTELGVKTVYTIGGPQNSLEGVTPLTDKQGLPLQDASDFRALHQTTNGLEHPFLLWPFGTDSEPWLVDWQAALQMRRHSSARAQYWPFAVKEVSRGLPWP